jgi:hypothetical protein
MSIFSTTDIASAQNSYCNACNCQFNNVKVLKELIQAEITNLQRNETGEKLFTKQILLLKQH